ncbi:MAG: MFS transporter [Spirochaetales bacterium]|nr:MFS transporter [Spirochaetales bacterium]
MRHPKLSALAARAAALPGRGLAYLRGFPRPVLLLTVATLIESTGRFMAVPYLTLRMRDAGVSLGALGAVLGAAPLASVIFGAWGGTLADRVGRKPVQIAGVATSGLALIGFAFAGANPLALGVLNFLNGMTRTFYRPATQAAIADHCPPERRSEAYALNRIALNAAYAWGPLIGLAIFPVAPSLGFVAGGLLNLAAGIYIALVVPESAPALRARAAAPRARRREAAAEWRAILRDGVFWAWTAGMALVWGAYDLIQSFLPLHLRESGQSLSTYGAVLFANAAVCVLAQLPLSRLLRTAPIAPSAGLSKLAYAAGFLGFAFLPYPATAVLAMLVLSAGEIWGSAVQSRFVPEHAKPVLLGRYQGLSVASELGRAVVAPVAGLLMQRYGSRAVFVAAAAVSIAGGLVLHLSGSAHDRAAARRAAVPAGSGGEL